MKLIAGYGFDGTDHQEFCQRWRNAIPTKSKLSSKAYAMVTTMNVVRLISESGNILWRCPAPMSSRYCRVIRISFEQETEIAIRTEYERLQLQIAGLKLVDINGKLKKNFCT